MFMRHVASESGAPSETSTTRDAPDVYETCGRALDYWLPPHVYACDVLGGALFLDLRRNRYFGVGDVEAAALRQYVANWPRHGLAEEDPALCMERASSTLTALANAELLAGHGNHERPFSVAKLITADTLRGIGDARAQGGSVSAGDTLRFFRSCAWARWVLHSRSLFEIARSIHEFRRADGRHVPPGSSVCEVDDVVHMFRRLRPYTFTAQDQCLFHALALVRFLRCYELHAAWVIGIRIRPWAAHSWVQCGEAIVDGTPESVCEYTPIIAV